jgi:hypothetical protein
MINIKYYRLIVLIFFLLLFSLVSVMGQKDTLSSEYNDDPKCYYSFGVSVYSDYISGNLNKVPQIDTSILNNQSFYKGHQYQAMNLVTFTYLFRYNIYRINNDRSISLSIPMSLGLNSLKCDDGSSAYLSLTIPLFLQYNYGAASNFSTLKWKGWMIGAGAEFVMFPLVTNEEYVYINEQKNSIKFAPNNKWIQPAVECSYRWINTDQEARELNLKMGYGFQQKWNDLSGSHTISPFSVKLTYIFSINY